MEEFIRDLRIKYLCRFGFHFIDFFMNGREQYCMTCKTCGMSVDNKNYDWDK